MSPEANASLTARSRLLPACVVSVLAGAMGGFLVSIGSDYAPRTGPILYPLAALYGIIVAELSLKSAGRAAPRLDALLAGGLTIGALGGRFIVACVVFLSSSAPGLRLRSLETVLTDAMNPVVLIALAAAICGSLLRTWVSRIRSRRTLTGG